MVCKMQGKLSRTYTLHGHKDGGNTVCPGQALYSEIRKWSHFGGPINKAVLFNGPAGPGPRAPKAQGPPNSARIIFLSREIIVTNCVIFHWLNK